MVLSWKVGSVPKLGTAVTGGSGTPIDHNTIPDSTGGGPNFQVKALLLFSAGTNSALVDILRPGMGVSAGPTANRSISWGSDDAANMATTGTNAFRRCSEEYCFMLGSAGSSTYPKMKVKTFNVDGSVTFTYDQNDTSTYNLNYIALGGADITNVKVGSFNLPTTTGNFNVTWSGSPAGFDPDLVLFFGANDAPVTGAGTNQSTPHATWFMGAAASATNQNVMANNSLDGVVDSAAPPVTLPHAARYQRTNRCIALFAENSVTAPLWAEADYVGSIINGFTLNVSVAPTSSAEAAANPIFYIAIKGGTWKVGNFSAPVAPTTGDQVVSGLGGSFTPKALMLYGNQGNTFASVSPAGHKFSIGASGASVQWNMIGGDDNTPDPAGSLTETIRGTVTGSGGGILYRSATETALTPDPATDITSSCIFNGFAAGQFTVNWTLTDANARQILYIAGGDSPPGAALVKIPTAETVGISETVRRPMKKTRRGPNTIGITEAIVRRRGLVRIVGGPLPPPDNVGFTSEGFIPSGFTTDASSGGGSSGDYSVADFSSSDYTTGDAPAATTPEGIGITEIVNYKLTTSVATISAANMTLRYSGGSGYNGAADKGVLSVGGGISNTLVADNVLNSAWDDVTFGEATAGESEYRCFYLRNSHPTLTAYDVRMWIDTNTVAPGEEIQIAVGAAAVNATESAVANENTSPPSGTVFFTTAPDENSAIVLGDIPALQYRAFWIKRVVNPASVSTIDNFYKLMISFASDETTT